MLQIQNCSRGIHSIWRWLHPGYEIVAHIKNKTKCIDDTLLWAPSIKDSFSSAVEWLDICGRNGITLNPDKFVFTQDSADFAGFEITNNSVRPCQKYLSAETFLHPRTSLTSGLRLQHSRQNATILETTQIRDSFQLDIW